MSKGEPLMTGGVTPPPSPFRFPIYRDVWIANLISNFGVLIQAVGAAWLMTSLGGSAEQVALVQSATTLPILLLALFAGAIADNFDRRNVMLLAQCFMCAVSLLLAVLALIGLLSPTVLLLFTFAVACGTAINGPAWQSSVGEMVPRESLPQAVAMNGIGFNIARSAGPAIGGLIVALAGGAAAFITNAVSSIGLIVVLARWQRPQVARVIPRESIGIAMSAGLRYVAMSPQICTVLGRSAIFGAGACAIPALLPLVARDVVRGGALTYGLLFGAFGLGAVAGAFTLRFLRARLSTERIVTIASLLIATGAAVSPFSHTILITLPAMALAGGGWMLALATFNVTVQLSSPRWVVARAIALYQTAAYGGMAVGSWLLGLIAHSAGLRDALLAATTIMLFSALLGLRWPISEIGQSDLDLADHWKEPSTTIPILQRSGPIAIEIEHRIDAANIPAFLIAMNERERIRRRDGARNWRLLRDLAATDIWLERYEFATWLDYVRHNQRRTVADLANVERINHLRVAGAPSAVRRLIGRQPQVMIDLGQAGRETMADPTRAT